MRCTQLIDIVAFNQVNKNLGAIDPVDVSGVIAKEDTTEGRESADEVGFEIHGRLDTIDIGGPREHRHRSARHDCCWRMIDQQCTE